MYSYFIATLFFILANYLASILVKKYTFEKFFIYVVIYFILVNFFIKSQTFPESFRTTRQLQEKYLKKLTYKHYYNGKNTKKVLGR